MMTNMTMAGLLLILLAQAVRFSLDNPACGTVDATTGVLTTPAQVPTPANCKVTATSTVDPTKSDTAAVSVAASPQPIAVVIAPKTVSAKPGETKQFTATVTGGSAPAPTPTPPPAAHATFEYLPGFPKGCTAALGPVIPANVLSVCRSSHENPLGTFPLPAIGGTWTDHNFGYPVRVLTRGNVSHAYPNPSALSATSKYLFAFPGLGNSGVSIVDVASTTESPLINISSGWPPHPHPNDDDLFFSMAGPGVRRHRVSTGAIETVLDLATVFPGVTVLQNGGMGNVTADGLLGFWVPEKKQACVINVFTKRLYCSDYGTFDTVLEDSVLVSHGVDSTNGKRYVRMGTFHTDVFFTVNEALGQLDFAFRGPDGLHAQHGDLAHDAAGRQYLFTEWDLPGDQTGGSGREYVLMPLAAEANLVRDRRLVAKVHVGGNLGDVWPAPHFSCSVNKPVCAVSIPQEPKRADTDLTTALVRGNYTGEVWSLFLGDTLRVKRLFQHGSITDGSYWRTPRASTNGIDVVVATNGWDPQRQVFVVMAPTGF